MQQVSLQRGLSLSRLVYGVWRWDEKVQTLKDITKLVDTCLHLGLDSFDHADLYNDYRNEAFFGQWLKQNPSLRKAMKLVSKCGIQLLSESRPQTRIKHYDYRREHIRQSVEQSLKNLGTDYLDVLLLHRPSPLLDAAVVAETLTSLVQSGKVRAVGVSNFTPGQFRLLQSAMSIPLVTNQIELNLLHHEPLIDGSIDFLYQEGIHAMIWSPLGGGSLFQSANTPCQQVLQHMAGKYQVGADALALAWLLKHPACFIPVIGTNRAERIATSVQALSIDLDLQDWFALYTAARGKEVP